MTIRFQLIMLLVAAILAVNSVLSLVGVSYVNAVWMREIQDRVRVSLNSAQAAYNNHEQRILSFLEATSLDRSMWLAINESDDQAVQRALDDIYAAGQMDFVTLLGREGAVRYRATAKGQGKGQWGENPLVAEVRESGQAASGTIVLTAEQLAAEDPALAERAAFDLLPTPAAQPTQDRVRTDGMCIAAVVPIYDDDHQMVGMLVGW